MSPSRLAVVLIALCLVVAGVVLRAHWTSESQSLIPGTTASRSDPEREPATTAMADGSRVAQ